MDKTQIQIAKDLGIENADNLSATQLKKAIEIAQSKKNTLETLKLKATQLGIVFSDDVTEDVLKVLVEDAVKIEDDKSVKIFALIEATIGFEKFESLSAEDLVEYLKTKQLVTNVDTEVVISKKTDKTITINSIEYGFYEKAPESFKFMGVIKTQEEWIEDVEAMNLMVSGNLSYVKPLKK